MQQKHKPISMYKLLWPAEEAVHEKKQQPKKSDIMNPNWRGAHQLIIFYG